MENHTVIQFNAPVKQQDVKRYSGLRKAKLIQQLEASPDAISMKLSYDDLTMVELKDFAKRRG